MVESLQRDQLRALIPSLQGRVEPPPRRYRIQIAYLTIIKLFPRHPSRNTRTPVEKRSKQRRRRRRRQFRRVPLFLSAGRRREGSLRIAPYNAFQSWDHPFVPRDNPAGKKTSAARPLALRGRERERERTAVRNERSGGKSDDRDRDARVRGTRGPNDRVGEGDEGGESPLPRQIGLSINRGLDYQFLRS